MWLLFMFELIVLLLLMHSMMVGDKGCIYELCDSVARIFQY